MVLYFYLKKEKSSSILCLGRCQVAARTIANALRDICKKILIERSLAQSSSKLTGQLAQADRREKLAARPTSLAVETGGQQGRLGLKLARPDTETQFPTPLEEPRKEMQAWYLGCLQVKKSNFFLCYYY